MWCPTVSRLRGRASALFSFSSSLPAMRAARRSAAAAARCAPAQRRSLATAAGRPGLPAEWTKLAAEDLRGKPADALVWKTPEGIDVKPVYTAADVDGASVPQIPGVFPYTRGVRATMYTVKPWTIRQVRRPPPPPPPPPAAAAGSPLLHARAAAAECTWPAALAHRSDRWCPLGAPSGLLSRVPLPPPRAVRRLLDRRGVQRLLPQEPGRGAAGLVRGV